MVDVEYDDCGGGYLGGSDDYCGPEVYLGARRERACTRAYRPKTVSELVASELAKYLIPSEIAARAGEIYAKVAESRIRRDKPRQQLLFYSVYCAYLERGFLRDPYLLAASMNLHDKKLVNGAFTRYTVTQVSPPVVIYRPSHLVYEYCESIGLEAVTRSEVCRQVIEDLNRFPSLTEEDPRAMTAAMIYNLLARNNALPRLEGGSVSSLEDFARHFKLTRSSIMSARRKYEDALAPARARPRRCVKA